MAEKNDSTKATGKVYARDSVLVRGHQFDRGEEIPAELLDSEQQRPSPRESLEQRELLTGDRSEFKSDDDDE